MTGEKKKASRDPAEKNKTPGGEKRAFVGKLPQQHEEGRKKYLERCEKRSEVGERRSQHVSERTE